ncbi:hypothetical protein EVAR_21544_1 [Eumeta japonica]|uniref:Uncharacterized protein n=1 Tax=Eumeta variegata TaxID=151549 RepID=A0A4C1UXN1_EUMVA|nr:hypothetical protein EVAR_21544_1 [Eumeta japonica]
MCQKFGVRPAGSSTPVVYVSAACLECERLRAACERLGALAPAPPALALPPAPQPPAPPAYFITCTFEGELFDAAHKAKYSVSPITINGRETSIPLPRPRSQAACGYHSTWKFFCDTKSEPNQSTEAPKHRRELKAAHRSDDEQTSSLSKTDAAAENASSDHRRPKRRD